MKRKIYQKLLDWKNNSNGKTALLIEGARRVGKTYIVEEFAKNEYSSYMMINFSKETEKVRRMFTKRNDDVTMLLQKLSSLKGVVLENRKTLIVFDEVQKCPEARELIKFLVEDGRYDYIETGSLISIHENVEDIVIPSEEERIAMDPMDFEEFCWAIGNETIVPYIRECFSSRKPMGDEMHSAALNLFRQYMIVGGMPMAVKAYSKSRNFSDAEIQKRIILDLYKEDVGKKSKRLRRKVSAMFKNIPSELSKHDKVFVLSNIEKGASFDKFDSALYWLEESKMVNVCFNSSEPSVGLSMSLTNNRFKCYMADTGLLITMAMSSDDKIDNEVYKSILLDKLHLNEGMFTENIVAQMLKSNGHALFFNVSYDRERNNNRYEVDFLIRDGLKISPVEVKSGTYDRHTSLDLMMKRYSKHIGQCYIVNEKDLVKKGRVLYIPLYMTLCL